MIQNTDEIMIRRATQEDYTELISIISGDKYDIDYLADYFPVLFGKPFFHGYVYIIKGQIVCMNIKGVNLNV